MNYVIFVRGESFTFVQQVSNKPLLKFSRYTFEIEESATKIREILCAQCSDGSLPSNSMEY